MSAKSVSTETQKRGNTKLTRADVDAVATRLKLSEAQVLEALTKYVEGTAGDALNINEVMVQSEASSVGTDSRKRKFDSHEASGWRSHKCVTSRTSFLMG